MPVFVRKLPLSQLVLVLAFVLAAFGMPPPAVAAPPEPVADDTLAATLAGEYALQAGRLDEAARWYLDAARAARDDAGLAEHATRIALLADDDARAAQALELWRSRAPRSLAIRAAEATLALRRNDARDARRGLESLLRDKDPDGWRHALVALGSDARIRHCRQAAGRVVDCRGHSGNWMRGWHLRLAQRLDRMHGPHGSSNKWCRCSRRTKGGVVARQQLREADKIDEDKKVLADWKMMHACRGLRLSVAAEYDALGDPRRPRPCSRMGRRMRTTMDCVHRCWPRRRTP